MYYKNTLDDAIVILPVLHNMIGKKECELGNSLAVQWLGLDAFTALAQVQSLVRGTKVQCSVAEKNKEWALICTPVFETQLYYLLAV